MDNQTRKVTSDEAKQMMAQLLSNVYQELADAVKILEMVVSKELTQKTAAGTECLYCEGIGGHHDSCCWLHACAFLAQRKES